MSLLGRIVVILFAFMLATFAAGITMSIALLGPQWHVLSGDVGERAGFWVLAFFASSFTGGVIFLPLLVFVVLAESLRWRSPLIYAAAGALLMLIAYSGLGAGNRVAESVDRPPPLVREMEVDAAAGVVFGLVYWLVAGRKAGAWRGQKS